MMMLLYLIPAGFLYLTISVPIELYEAGLQLLPLILITSALAVATVGVTIGVKLIVDFDK